MISHFYHQQEIITGLCDTKKTLVISSRESQRCQIWMLVPVTNHAPPKRGN